MRKRFGNALQWYAVLEDRKQLQVQEVLNDLRNDMLATEAQGDGMSFKLGCYFFDSHGDQALKSLSLLCQIVQVNTSDLVALLAFLEPRPGCNHEHLSRFV